MVNIKTTADAFASKAALCGNIDPVSIFLQGSYALAREKTWNEPV